MPCFKRGEEIGCPRTCMHARLSLVTMMNDDRSGVIGNAITPESVAAYKRLTHDFRNGCIDLFGARALVLLFGLRVSMAPDAVGEIDRGPQEGAEIADRVLGAPEMIPTGFDDIRQKFLVKPRLAHQFEDQKFTKSQRQQALEIRGQAS
ncbi:protein of unknown function (plasmid) [Caballeronia sp. S22]